MNNSDLSAIREQLLAVKNGSPSDSEADPQIWENSRSPSLPLFSDPTSGSPGHAPQTEMVQALRQRSPQTNRQPTPEEMAASSGAAPTNIHHYLRRLYEEAERINALCRQQEIAIQKFQRTVKGLDIILLKQGDGIHSSEQFCELRNAALTTVIQDKAGRYILTALEIDLTVDEQQAFQDAAEIRSWGQGRSQHDQGSGLWSSLVTDPISVLDGLWRSLTGTLESRTRITPLDILVWCGGGVIARKALNLAVVAVPALGHWVLAIIIGAVILGLYRVLSSQRTDLAFVARLFLVLAGLGIGGQL